MAISAKDVMELRKQTDCGMMECKKALTEADGNFEKAIEILRERGLATAAKKAGRIAAEGMVYADYCPECKVGVVIEVNAETDFVAKNDKFVDFVKKATKVIMEQNPADVETLMNCKMSDETVDNVRQIMQGQTQGKLTPNGIRDATVTYMLSTNATPFVKLLVWLLRSFTPTHIFYIRPTMLSGVQFTIYQ